MLFSRRSRRRSASILLSAEVAGLGLALTREYAGAPKHTHIVRWSPDGSAFAVTGDGKAAVWRGDETAPAWSLDVNDQAVVDLAWHPTRFALAIAADPLLVYEIGGGPETVRVPLDGVAEGLAWSSDGRLAVTTRAGDVTLWGQSDLGFRQLASAAHVTAEPPVWWLPDGNLVTCDRGRSLTVWSSTLEPVRRIGDEVRYDTAVTPDGRLVACGSEEPSVHVYNLQTGRAVAVLERHTDSVASVCFSPGGDFLATSDASGVSSSGAARTGNR